MDMPLSRASLSGKYPTGVHPVGVHLMGVYPVGMHLIGMHFVGVPHEVHLMDVPLMACILWTYLS